MLSLFNNTKLLEQKVDSYLDFTSQTGIIFQQGINDYLYHKDEEFEQRVTTIRELERKADDLRREIEDYLYLHTLIPESRGDVLAIMENTDNVIDRAKNTLLEFSIEMPYIPEELKQDFLDLSSLVVQCMESMVCSTRSFFKDVYSVKQHLHKVHFFEHEADQISEKLKRKIFRSNTLPHLAFKNHLRYFALHIDLIADLAEDVADRVSIYTIKRMM